MFGSFGVGGRRGRSFHVLQYMRCCVRHDVCVLFSMLVWYIPGQAGPRHRVSGTGNGVGISISYPLASRELLLKYRLFARFYIWSRGHLDSIAIQTLSSRLTVLVGAQNHGRESSEVEVPVRWVLCRGVNYRDLR